MNYLSAGQVIKDSVDSLGVMIAFYYGLTGFSCIWYYRKNLTSSLRNFFMQGILPAHRRPHLVVHPRLVLLVLLAAGQQLHALGHLRPPDRRACSSSTSGCSLLGFILMFTMQAFPARLLPGRDAEPGLATLVTDDYVAKQTKPRLEETDV